MADQTAQELIKAALRKIGAISRGKAPSGADMADGLEALKILLRGWSGQGTMVFKQSQDTHTLTAGTASYSIGSGATIGTTRPVRVEGAYVNSGGVDYPLNIIGADKYRNIAQKDSGSAVPSELHYQPGYSRGTIFLWPPGGGTLYLDSLKPLTEPSSLTTSMTFPGEYDAAIVWNLACELGPEYGKEPTMYMLARAQETKDNIIAINAALSIETADVQIIDSRRPYNIDQG